MKKLVYTKSPQADLTRYYKRDFMVSVILVLILLIIAFRVQFNPNVEIQITEREREIIQLEDIIQTQQETLPPPPRRPRLPAVVPDEVVVEDTFFDFDFDQPDLPLLPPPPPVAAGGEEEQEPEFFIAVEQMPTIIGGTDALYSILEYPDLARRAGIEGRVIVQFIIDEEGNVIDPYIIRGVGAGLDEAALRAVSQLKFEPGRQRGRAVRVQYTIPVTFRLDQGTRR